MFQFFGKIQVFVNLFAVGSAGMAKFTRQQVLFFLLINTRSGLLAEVSDSFVSQSPKEFYTSRTDYGLGKYPIYQPLRSGRIWHKVNF